MRSSNASSQRTIRHSWLARHRGGIALSVASVGFIASECVASFGVLSPISSQLCVSAFEGALVGSLADWFAVTALFKKIPIPFLSRHTGLIAQRREALSRGIVDMVENEWLSPDALREHLKRFSFADMLVRRISSQEGSEALQKGLRKQLLKATDHLDEPYCLKLLDHLVKMLVEKINPGAQIAPLIRRLSRDPELLNQLWHGAIAILERVLQDPHLLEVLSDILLDQLESMSNEGRWKSVKVWLGKQFLDGEDDRDKVERLLTRLLNSAQSQLIEIEEDEHHPLRLRMRALLTITARHLERDEGSRLNELLERSKWQLFNTYEEQRGSQAWIGFAKRWLREQLSTPDSTASQLLKKGTDQLVIRQLTNPDTRERFDERIRQWAGQLLNDYPDAIGNVVRDSLSEARMPTEHLVASIENRVGPDLQWIRVNGAVVGGGVALLIAAARISIHALV